MEKWSETQKHKPERYLSRNEIEEIVKTHNIDRTRFCEYSESDYPQILKKFYYSFVDYKKYPAFHLNYVWLHFRDALRQVFFQYDTDRFRSLESIKQYFIRRGHPKLWLIVSDGWVYEGYVDEIVSVLSETDGITIEDFYIVSPEFDSFAMYCSDGDCISIYEK